jgi:adenylate cyclase
MPVTTTLTGTIVFTDIVGFTQLTDEHGDDVAVTMLERQEQLVRQTLPDDARVVKELGDGLLLWFDDASTAIMTCLDLQRAFEDESEGDMPMWVRIGMHWGCPRARGDDIIGRDVNLAARISELAGPGEVLCSEATAERAGDVPGCKFEALGSVFVRGIADAIPLMRAVSV